MITKKIMELADAYAMGRLAESQKARNDLLAVVKRIQKELQTLNANNAKLQIERDAQAAEIERLMAVVTTDNSATLDNAQAEIERLQARIAEMEGKEPVAAQLRLNMETDTGWSEWREIDIKDVDREYRDGVETRRLYLAPGAAPKEPLTEQQRSAVWESVKYEGEDGW